jgi:hypothetical protein
MVTQRIRLEQEGVAFRAGRVVLARHRWREAARASPVARAKSPSLGAPRGRAVRVAWSAWP